MTRHQRTTAVAMLGALALTTGLLHATTSAAVPSTASSSSSLTATAPAVTMFRDVKARNWLCRIPADQTTNVNFTQNTLGCNNDEAESMVIEHMPAGTVIRVFDDSSCQPAGDDVTVITLLTDVTGAEVWTFEADQVTAHLDVDYQTSGNLDDHVSCVSIDRPPSSPSTVPSVPGVPNSDVRFFYRNDGRDFLCSVFVNGGLDIEFDGRSGCKNDRARSMVLQNLEAGTTLAVFEDSSCTPSGDDWTIVLVLQDLISPALIPTFETELRGNEIFVEPQTSGGLDGEVSCVRVTPPGNSWSGPAATPEPTEPDPMGSYDLSCDVGSAVAVVDAANPSSPISAIAGTSLRIRTICAAWDSDNDGLVGQVHGDQRLSFPLAADGATGVTALGAAFAPGRQSGQRNDMMIIVTFDPPSPTPTQARLQFVAVHGYMDAATQLFVPDQTIAGDYLVGVGPDRWFSQVTKALTDLKVDPSANTATGSVSIPLFGSYDDRGLPVVMTGGLTLRVEDLRFEQR